MIRLEAGAGDAMVDHEVIRHTDTPSGTAVKTKTITKDSEVKAEIVISYATSTSVPEIERRLPQVDLPQDKCSMTFALKGQLPQVTWTFAPKTDD